MKQWLRTPYRRAAAKGDTGAQYVLGDWFYRSNDQALRTEGLSWWAKAGEAGHADAQMQMAHVYLRVEPRPAEAVKWWRLMAARGDEDGSHRLAWALHTGWGVERNQQEALTIWRKLAKRDDVEANYYLGAAAADGDGVPQDRAKAVRLWRKNGNLPSRYHPKRYLALCLAYANGDGVERDPVEAVQWCRPISLGAIYDQPMRPEDEESAHNLATASITVISIVEQRRDKAEGRRVLRSLLPELREHAVKGEARAQFFLAEALSRREWAGCNPREAIEWYERAAAQHYEYADKLVAGFKKGTMVPCTPDR